MAALFTPRSNTTIRLALALAVASFVGCPTILMVYARTPHVTGEGERVDQPIEFDHRHHVRDDGIDCRYCHNTVDRSPHAGIPSTALCMGCHNQIWNNAPLLEAVRRSYFSGKPIEWRRVHDLADFVYFDHSAHVSHGIGCVSCHGRVDQMPLPRQVEPMTMGWCLDCHRAPERHVRPLENITDMDWEPPVLREELGVRLVELYGIEKKTHCTVCHR